MPINASDIVKLRSQTGAGMMDCKKALEEASGNLDQAAEILRKKGVVKAAKRADKVAAEGLVAVFVDPAGKFGALAEINSETDFVAKSEDFIKFAQGAAESIARNNPADLSAAVFPSGEKLADAVGALTVKIGEKIGVRRFARYDSTDGKIYSYLHGAKIGVLLEMTGGDAELGTDIAMQIAASNPRYLERAAVPDEIISKEKEIYSEQLKQQGKPQNIIDNILKGKIEKFYEEVCLVDQVYIKDETKKVKDLLSGKGAVVKRYVRYELGEGIEKAQKDFAAEVAEQLK